jgi:hypothetical protein
MFRRIYPLQNPRNPTPIYCGVSLGIPLTISPAKSRHPIPIYCGVSLGIWTLNTPSVIRSTWRASSLNNRLSWFCENTASLLMNLASSLFHYTYEGLNGYIPRYLSISALVSRSEVRFSYALNYTFGIVLGPSSYLLLKLTLIANPNFEVDISLYTS